jgi:hypothetical protein
VVLSGTTAYVLSQDAYYWYGGVETDGAPPAEARTSGADAYYPCYYSSPMELVTLDLADPAALKTTNTQEMPISYGYVRALDSGRLFVDGSYDGLLVYDVETDPLTPSYVDFARTSGWAYHVRIQDRTAYLPAGMYGVSVWTF